MRKRDDVASTLEALLDIRDILLAQKLVLGSYESDMLVKRWNEIEEQDVKAREEFEKSRKESLDV